MKARWTKLLWFVIGPILVAAAAVALLAVHSQRRPIATPLPAGLKLVTPPTAADNEAIAVRGEGQIGLGCPDGQGHGLFWVCLAPKWNFHLLRLPEPKVLCTVSNPFSPAELRFLTTVSWLPGAVAVARIDQQKPGVPILDKLPLFRGVKPVGEHVGPDYYSIDWANYRMSPLPCEKWPREGETVIWYGSVPGYAASVGTRGGKELSIASTKDARGREWAEIDLCDKATGTKRAIFKAGPDLPPELRNAEIKQVLFVTDDLVMFQIKDRIWQTSIATGKAEQVWPSLKDSRSIPAVQTTDSQP